MALRPRSVSVAQLSWVTPLYSYVTYEVEKCPLHAQNEYTVAALGSINNKVYRLQQKREWMNDSAETMNISPAHYFLDLAQIL
jgi:hypothetical protein